MALLGREVEQPNSMRPSGERGAQPSATRCVRLSGDGTDCDTEELKSWAADAAERYMVQKNSWRIARGSYEVAYSWGGSITEKMTMIV